MFCQVKLDWGDPQFLQLSFCSRLRLIKTVMLTDYAVQRGLEALLASSMSPESELELLTYAFDS